MQQLVGISVSKVKQNMDDKKRKFMIEISVNFYDEEEFEHEGYYTSPDQAKEAIDQLYEMFNNEVIDELNDN